MCGGPEGSVSHEIDLALHRRWRETGETLGEIACALGISRPHLAHMVSGRRRLSAAVAVRLERLGLDAEDLMLRQAREEIEAVRMSMMGQPGEAEHG